MMDCKEAESQLTLYLYDELAPERRSAMEEHLAACKLCQKQAAQLRQLHQLLSSRCADEASPELLAWCRQALDEAIDREAKRTSWAHIFAHIFPGLNALPATRGARVAALVLLGFGLGWTLRPLVARRIASPSGAESASVAAADLGNFHINGISQVSPGPASGEVNITVDAERHVTLTGSLDNPRIRGVLLDAMKNYDNAGIRRDSLDALKSRMNEPSVRDALLYAMRHDPNAGVRLKALQSVRQMDWAPEVRKAVLETLLKDTNAGVRVEAVDVLSNHADEQVLPALERLAVKDPNPYVRLKCISAVRRIAPDAF